jgi:hypothetical protein
MFQLVIAFLPWVILAVLGNRWFELALMPALAASRALHPGVRHLR